ncbi:hypothetical protein MY8738_009377 [Beauveria namnaoensis]
MAMIYQKAWLTISVDISKASTEGCFNDGRKHNLLTLEDGVGFKVDIPAVLDNGHKSKLQLFAPVATFSNPDSIQGTPLTTRAWTFQEQALSRRILHYTSSGLNDIFCIPLAILNHRDTEPAKCTRSENAHELNMQRHTRALPPNPAGLVALVQLVS